MRIGVRGRRDRILTITHHLSLFLKVKNRMQSRWTNRISLPRGTVRVDEGFCYSMCMKAMKKICGSTLRTENGPA